MEHQRQVWHRGVSHPLGNDLFEKPITDAGELGVAHASERCDV
jgi:hypothetical protein